MACLICTDVPIKRLKSIDRHIKAGKKTIREIAEHYDLDIETLRKHARQCVQSEALDDSELIDRSIRELRWLLDQFKSDIECGKHLEVDDASGTDGRSLVAYFVNASRELREAIVARKKLRSSDETLAALTTTVLNPFIEATVSIATQESRRLRDDLFALVKDENAHHRIKIMIDEMLARMADRIGTEAMEDLPAKVEAAVGTSRSMRQ
jgi:hypothetical protein